MDRVTYRGQKDLVISFDFPPEIGGAHKWLYEVYRRWPVTADVLTHCYSQDGVGEETARNFDTAEHGSLRIIRSIPRYGDLSVWNPGFLRALWQCRREARKISHSAPLRLHALRAFPEGFAGYVIQRTTLGPAKLVTYAHGEELLVAHSSRQLLQMTRLAYGRSNLVIANSEHTRQAVLDVAPGVRTEVIHPGVDCESLETDVEMRQHARAGLGWSAETVVVLTLGRMEPRKNHAGVIRAIARLHRSGLKIGYVCAGDGPERSAITLLAESEGIVPWVRFPGAVEEGEKRRLFAAADIFAMPSVRVGSMIEGFGIVFLEAAAAGLPVICGSSGGQPEAVQDGITGRVIDGTSIESIAGAIEELAVMRDRRAEMGLAARAWARRHEWSGVVSATVAALDREADAPVRNIQ